jgi:hypothetical protein
MCVALRYLNATTTCVNASTDADTLRLALEGIFGQENVYVSLKQSNTTTNVFLVGFVGTHLQKNMYMLEANSTACSSAATVGIKLYQEGSLDATQFSSTTTTTEAQTLFVRTERCGTACTL